MEIYKDKGRKEKLKTIYFGQVKAGEVKTITVWLFNETKAMLTNLEFNLQKNIPQAERVELINPPITIQPGKILPLKLVWAPTKTLKEALEVILTLKGEEVYMASKTFPVEKEVKK